MMSDENRVTCNHARDCRYIDMTGILYCKKCELPYRDKTGKDGFCEWCMGDGRKAFEEAFKKAVKKEKEKKRLRKYYLDNKEYVLWKARENYKKNNK